MPAIFDALPGFEVPVGDIGKRLAQMWSEEGAQGRPTLSAEDAKATQVNFVLHLGFRTQPQDAVRQFQTVVNFSHRYPGRVVVLCPRLTDVPEPEIRAKIYGECFLGRSKSDKRCVEFVMLSYSRSARPFLENQVSICLSADLPLYYWAHRFSESGRLADYQYLLSRAKRVLIDSAIAPADALTFPWPNPGAIRDLVASRLLPVRQTVGQFLSAYPPAVLVEDLTHVTVSHADELAAEGRVTSDWLRKRLAECGASAERVTFATRALGGGEGRLAIRFEYAREHRFFSWRGDLQKGQAVFEAEFGAGRTTLQGGVSLLPPESALGEAMFF
jgi:hypothetical protein